MRASWKNWIREESRCNKPSPFVCSPGESRCGDSSSSCVHPKRAASTGCRGQAASWHAAAHVGDSGSPISDGASSVTAGDSLCSMVCATLMSDQDEFRDVAFILLGRAFWLGSSRGGSSKPLWHFLNFALLSVVITVQAGSKWIPIGWRDLTHYTTLPTPGFSVLYYPLVVAWGDICLYFWFVSRMIGDDKHLYCFLGIFWIRTFYQTHSLRTFSHIFLAVC